MLQNRTSQLYETCLNDIRGAVYTMVADLSQKNIRVSLNNEAHKNHMDNVRQQLKVISHLLNDDTIELDVQMDTSRDELIARRLQDTM
jgi:hypothetical protein